MTAICNFQEFFKLKHVSTLKTFDERENRHRIVTKEEKKANNFFEATQKPCQ